MHARTTRRPAIKGKHRPVAVGVPGTRRILLLPVVRSIALSRALLARNRRIWRKPGCWNRLRATTDAQRIVLLEQVVGSDPQPFTRAHWDHGVWDLPRANGVDLGHFPPPLLNLLAGCGGPWVRGRIASGTCGATSFLPVHRTLLASGDDGACATLARRLACLPQGVQRQLAKDTHHWVRESVVGREDVSSDLLLDLLRPDARAIEAEDARMVAERVGPEHGVVLRCLLDHGSLRTLQALAENPRLSAEVALELCAKARDDSSAPWDSIANTLAQNHTLSDVVAETLLPFATEWVWQALAYRPTNTATTWTRLVAGDFNGARDRAIRHLANKTAHERLALFARAVEAGLAAEAERAARVVAEFLSTCSDAGGVIA